MNNLNIFIICNKHREKNRYTHSQEQISKHLSNFNIKINYYYHIWADEITDDIYKKYCKTDKSMIKHGRNMKINPLTKGEVSLVLNNVNCLKKILKEYKEGYFLILESDFFLFDNFYKNLEKIINFIQTSNLKFDIVNIGKGFREYIKKKNLNKIINTIKIDKELSLIKTNLNCGAEGLLWKIESIKKFIQNFEEENDINGPWDTILDTLEYNFCIYWSSFPFLHGLSVTDKNFKSEIH
tara:strand:+ start:910 stop:1626 length:717 start_codon:yes stop_codon:yes gene_type:complete